MSTSENDNKTNAFKTYSQDLQSWQKKHFLPRRKANRSVLFWICKHCWEEIEDIHIKEELTQDILTNHAKNVCSKWPEGERKEVNIRIL